MKSLDNEKGMILITILLLAVLLTMMTVSMVFISSNHLHIMGNVEQKVKALKAAEAVAEYALTQLNKYPAWGMWDPLKSTGVGSDDEPNAIDNIEISFDEATGSIHFTKGPYMSYNNLRYQDPMNRGDIGETKLSGTIPSYTAELICKGETKQGTVQYLKVIFIRNDIYPYPINSDGQIKFASEGDIFIFGSSDISNPGYIHSNWDGPDDVTNPDHYSIKTGGDPGDLKDPNFVPTSWLDSGNLDMNGGVAAAVGEIKVKYINDNVIPATDPEGQEEFENLGVSSMLDEAKKIFLQ